MFSQAIRRWFAPARPIRRLRSRPRLEELESRLTPSDVGADFRISNMGPDGDAAFDAASPAVAYNSRLNQHLVVWSGNDTSDTGSRIHGQLLNAATGRPLGANFPISSGSGYAPTAAYNSDWNEYLVVWRRFFVERDGFRSVTRIDIYGARLSAAGDLINHIQITDVVRTDTTPALAYNSTDNQYLVVWDGLYSTDPWESEILGQRLGPAGNEVGVNDFRISDMGPAGDGISRANAPAVVYNEADNEYLVVWSADDNSGALVNDEYEIFGQRLDANPDTFGEVGINDFRISDMGTNGDPFFDALRPALAYNSADNEYLVVWEGNDGTTDSAFEIYGQRLAGATAVATGANDFCISDLGADGDHRFDASNPAVAYNRLTNRYMVVWSGDDDAAPLVNDEFEIFGQSLDANPATFGEVGPNDFRISAMGPHGNTAFEAGNPAVVSSESEFLAVWEADDDTAPLVNDEFEIFGHYVGSIDRPFVIYDPAQQELLIHGTSRADDLGLSADALGNIVVTSGGKALLAIDPNTGQASSPTLANTKTIASSLGAGDDRLEFTGAGFHAIDVMIHGEAGDDRLTLRSPAAAAQVQSQGAWMFHAGAGLDTFQLIATDLNEKITLMGEFEEDAFPCDYLRIEDLTSGALLAEIMAMDAETIKIDAGKGADAVAATIEWAGIIGEDGTPLPLSYLFNLGDGADRLDFDLYSEANLGLNLHVTGGEGADAIEAVLNWTGLIGPVDLPTAVNAVFDLGEDADTLEFNGSSDAANLSLNLQVHAGTEDDVIAAAFNLGGVIGPADLPTAVNAVVDLGAGADTLEFDVSSEAAKLSLNLQVDAGSGADDIALALNCPSDNTNAQLFADVAVNLGGDGDVFQFTGNAPAEQSFVSLKLDAGSGADDIIVADTSIAGTGNFNMNLGLDDDLLIFEQNTFQGLNINLSAGSGHDAVFMQGNTVTGAANLNFNLAAGNDTFTFLENNFTLGLAMYLYAGTGTDSVFYQSNAVTGAAKLTFHLATGNDSLAIRKSTFQQLTLTARAGPGRDRVSLEDNTITGPGKLTIDLGLGLDTFFSRRNKLGKNVTLLVIDPDKRR